MGRKELQRLEAVHQFLTRKLDKQQELRDIVKLAAAVCGTPTALITLIAEKSQHIPFKVGFAAESTSREDSFCRHLIGRRDMLIVPDSLQDKRFKKNPLVLNDPFIRFYAGAPLTTQDGYTLGSLCVIDQKPNTLTDEQQQMLQMLSRQVTTILEFEQSVEFLKEQFVKAKTSEIHLRSILESSSSCYLLVSRNLEIMAFNRPLALFVKAVYEGDIQVGMKVTQYIHTEYLPNFLEHFSAALSGRSITFDRLINYAQIGGIWWHFSFDPAYDAEGTIIGVSYNAVNINKRKQNEERILQQNSALREIAQIQSHEFRAPVAAILGLIKLFELNNYEHCEEYISLLKASTEALDTQMRRAIGLTV